MITALKLHAVSPRFDTISLKVLIAQDIDCLIIIYIALEKKEVQNMSKTDSKEWNVELPELAINNFPDPILWISKDGNVLRFNSAFSTLIDLLKLESTGLSLFDIDENLSRKEWKIIWKKLNETKFCIIQIRRI